MSVSGANERRSSSADRQFCTFELGGRQFGVDVGLVREVTLPQPIEPIPHAPTSIIGYVNLRGQVWLVVDPRPQLGLTGSSLGPDSRLVLLRPTAADGVCLLVDKIGDIATAPAAKMEASPNIHDGAEGRFAPEVLKTDELVWVLNVRELLAAVEQSVGRTESSRTSVDDQSFHTGNTSPAGVEERQG